MLNPFQGGLDPPVMANSPANVPVLRFALTLAILAVGATVQRFVHREDAGLWAPIAEFTLTADHRALDGATAARFLAVLRRELESPTP